MPRILKMADDAGAWHLSEADGLGDVGTKSPLVAVSPKQDRDKWNF